VIGLTGGIATGKTTVSTLFKQRGIPVIDADVLAREVVLPGTRTYAAIVATFGSGILQPDGYLDRAALGTRVFADATDRARLNAIVHPAVRRAMIWDVMRCWLRGERVCVLDVPLLIEAGLWRWVAKVVVVYWCVRVLGPRLDLLALTLSALSAHHPNSHSLNNFLLGLPPSARHIRRLTSSDAPLSPQLRRDPVAAPHATRRLLAGRRARAAERTAVYRGKTRIR